MERLPDKRGEHLDKQFKDLDDRINKLMKALNIVTQEVTLEPAKEDPNEKKPWNFQDAKKRMEDLRKENNQSVVISYRLKTKGKV